MHFLNSIEQLFRMAAFHMPLDWFVFLGSFLEEVVSPIPSALVMGTAGSLVLLRHEPLWYLFWLAVFGNVGKTLGAWLYYFIGDTLEDLFTGRFQKYVGFSHEDIERIGRRFTGHHWQDGGALFVIRFIPFFPTTPVSIVAGIIKMDIRVFLIATYFGNIIKDLFYIYAGYVGFSAFHSFWKHLVPFHSGAEAMLVITGLSVMLFLLIRRLAGREKSIQDVHDIHKK